MDISSMPLLPYLCNPARMYCWSAGGKHAMCVIPEDLHCNNGVLHHPIKWRMAMAWWVGWMRFVWFVLCDELVISVVSLWTGSSSIVGQKAPTQPAASSGWDAEAALGLSRIRFREGTSHGAHLEAPSLYKYIIPSWCQLQQLDGTGSQPCHTLPELSILQVHSARSGSPAPPDFGTEARARQSGARHGAGAKMCKMSGCLLPKLHYKVLEKLKYTRKKTHHVQDIVSSCFFMFLITMSSLICFIRVHHETVRQTLSVLLVVSNLGLPQTRGPVSWAQFSGFLHHDWAGKLENT